VTIKQGGGCGFFSRKLKGEGKIKRSWENPPGENLLLWQTVGYTSKSRIGGFPLIGETCRPIIDNNTEGGTI